MGNKIQKAKTTVISVAARSRIKFQFDVNIVFIYIYLNLIKIIAICSTFNLSIIPFCIQDVYDNIFPPRPN